MLIFSDSWGDNFPIADPDWDLIIASDILLCKHLILNINFYKYRSVLHWSGKNVT